MSTAVSEKATNQGWWNAFVSPGLANSCWHCHYGCFPAVLPYCVATQRQSLRSYCINLGWFRSLYRWYWENHCLWQVPRCFCQWSWENAAGWWSYPRLWALHYQSSAQKDAILKTKNNNWRLVSVLGTFSLGENATMDTRDNGAFVHDQADITMVSYVIDACGCHLSANVLMKRAAAIHTLTEVMWRMYRLKMLRKRVMRVISKKVLRWMILCIVLIRVVKVMRLLCGDFEDPDYDWQ